MKKIYFAMAIAALFTACADNSNPDVDYKGEIDDNYFEQLAQGQASAAFLHNQNETQVYSCGVIDSVPDLKWVEITDQVETSQRFARIDIHDGKSWVPYQPAETREEMVLYEPEIEIAWKEYVKKTGYDTTACILYPFLYKQETQQVCIDQVWYTIERANIERWRLSLNEMVSEYEEYKYVYTFYNNKIVTHPDNDDETHVNDVIQWGVPNQYFSKMKGFYTPTEIILYRLDVMRAYAKSNYWMYNPDDTDFRYLNIDLVKQLIEDDRTYDSITGVERAQLFGRPTDDGNTDEDGDGEGNDE